MTTPMIFLSHKFPEKQRKNNRGDGINLSMAQQRIPEAGPLRAHVVVDGSPGVTSPVCPAPAFATAQNMQAQWPLVLGQLKQPQHPMSGLPSHV